jgi:hypothetical protein
VRRHRAIGLLVAAAIITVSTAADAQAPAGARADAIDPIRCWWRTSAGAVATGEPFEASLTCAVYDDPSTSVVADESRLAAQAIQLGVFEVLGGSHPADLRTGTHRFFQYHYTLRVIDRDAIGKDASVPDIHVSYRVHTRSSGDTAEGRERTYVVPGQSIRVLSLVPGPAADIRDTAGESFAQVETLRFRSRALQLAALGLGALGLIVLAPALLAVARRGARSSSADAGPLRVARVLAEVQKELADVEGAARGGWTADLAARGASAIRLAASCALGRRVSSRPTQRASSTPGRISVRVAMLRRRYVSAASPVTSADLRSALDQLPLTTPAEARNTLEQLHHALSTLTSAIYGPAFEPTPALDEAITEGLAATARLRRSHAWPRAVWRSLAFGQPAESVPQ